jgi:hypothetical protein
MEQYVSLLSVIKEQESNMKSGLSQGVNLGEGDLKYSLPIMLGAVMSMNSRQLNNSVNNRQLLKE